MTRPTKLDDTDDFHQTDDNDEPGPTELTESIEQDNFTAEAPQQREVDDAAEHGLRMMHDLYQVKEPLLYEMGFFLDKDDPASHLAAFSAPKQPALHQARFGYAALQATAKLAEQYPQATSRQSAGFIDPLRSQLLEDQCPLRGIPRCPPASKRYRTADGTCNNFAHPWRGASMLPMQRFLSPDYGDGVQSVRRSVRGGRLPSPRDISIRVHRDRNLEMPTVTLMFMQWGQFLDHDIISIAQARSFNNSVPRCCQRGGSDLLPPEFTHPECLPISVSDDDWFLGPFGVRCLEFIRSAPSSRINCNLGWREQISQVTAYIDGSTIYGSDVDTSDGLRLLRNGQLQYGRSQNGNLRPPDPPGGELCRSGAITTDCFNPGDSRASEQPALTSMHTTWLRFHNRIASRLASTNSHWSDEKLYQEARRIIGALIQHITYREFLPIVLGPQVMELFELELMRKGFYSGYDKRVNPAPANAFGAAAFRFGHSLVQNSFLRSDSKHRTLLNNVSIHEEQDNVENIWSAGSVDRLLLGMCNQPSQRRDEFISEELTNHLFQSQKFGFGMDLAAINIQRGRDHGIPSFTAWREPCGLTPITTWEDLQKIMSLETVQRFRSLYHDIDDIDLFPAGLAEKPIRGAVVGPTFACIIAQQFSNLRKADRFWYENGDSESSFTPAQLQQIRRVTFAQVLCQTMTEIETVQPFVFLSADNFRNSRLPCDSPFINNFDLSAWAEIDPNDITSRFDLFKRETDEIEEGRGSKRRTTLRPNKKRFSNLDNATAYVKNQAVSKLNPIKITHVSTSTVKLEDKYGQDYYNEIPKRPQFAYARPTVTKTPKPTFTDDYYYLRPSSNQYQYPTYNRPDDEYHYPSNRPPSSSNPLDDTVILHPTSSPHDDVTYLIGLVQKKPEPPKTQKPNYQVNINIQYFISSTEKNEVKPVYEEFDNKRPTQSYLPPITNGHDLSRPIVENGYGTFANEVVITSKPKTTRRTRRPVILTGKPTRVTSKPIYITPKPTKTQRPTYQLGFSTIKPQTTTTRRPIYSNYYYDDPTTKKTRPQTYYLNRQTTERPYEHLNVQIYEEHDDPIKQLYAQILTGPVGPVRPDAYIQDKNDGHVFNYPEEISDKLDFKTKTYLPADFHDDGSKFVKISSTHGGYSAESKEGTFDLIDGEKLNVTQVNGTDGGKLPPILEIDVTPSEAQKNQWVIYNATDEIMPLVPVPDLNFNLTCATELPRPLKLLDDRTKRTPGQ